MGRPHGVAVATPRMVIAVVATLITCLALLATQLEFDHRDPHELIHHNKPHPRHATPRPRPLRVKGENVKLNIQNKVVATTLFWIVSFTFSPLTRLLCGGGVAWRGCGLL